MTCDDRSTAKEDGYSKEKTAVVAVGILLGMLIIAGLIAFGIMTVDANITQKFTVCVEQGNSPAECKLATSS